MALGAPPLAWFCAAKWPVLSPPLTPRDDHAELQDLRYDYRWVWQLDHLEIR